MKINPLGNRVLIKPNTDKLSLDYGLVQPKNVKDETKSYGKIVELGLVNGFSVGDVVVYKMYSGDEITHEGVSYMLVDVDDIIAVIK